MIKYSISILLSFLSMVSCGQITVNQPRMEKRITELAQFGKDANGRGYRVGYTKGDMEGRAYFMGVMKNAGLAVSIIQMVVELFVKKLPQNAQKCSVLCGNFIISHKVKPLLLILLFLTINF